MEKIGQLIMFMIHYARDPRSKSRIFKSAVFYTLSLIILIVCISLRWQNLSSGSMWFDEWDVVRVCASPLFDGFFRAVKSHVLAFPGDYLVVKLFLMFPGDPDLVFRIPAFIFGVGAVLIAIFLGREIFGSTFALILGGLITFSAYHIEQSQELRFYSSLFFFSLLIPLLSLYLLKHPTKKTILIITAIAIIGYQFHLMVSLGICLFYLIALYLPSRRFIKGSKKGDKEYGLKEIILVTIALLIGCLPVTYMYCFNRTFNMNYEKTPEVLASFWYFMFKFYVGINFDLVRRFFTQPWSLPVEIIFSVLFFLVTIISGLVFRKVLIFFWICLSGFATYLFLSVLRVGQYLVPRHYFFIYPILLITLSAGSSELLKRLFKETGNLFAESATRHKPLRSLLVIGIGILYLFAAYYYLGNHIKKGISLARMGDRRRFIHNPRKAMEYALKNSETEKIYFSEDGMGVRRAIRCYFDTLKFPRSRIRIGKTTAIDQEIRKEKSFWFFKRTNNPPKDLLKDGYYLKFQVGGGQDALFYIRQDHPINSSSGRNMNWRVEDCGILLSHYIWQRENRQPDEYFSLAADIVEFVPEIRLGRHRKFCYERLNNIFFFKDHPLAKTRKDDFLQLAYRCTTEFLSEGFDAGHETYYCFLLTCQKYGDMATAYECARRGIQLKPRSQGGVNYRGKMMAYMILVGAKKGWLQRDYKFLQRIEKKEPEGPIKEEMKQHLENAQKHLKQ